MSNDSTRARSRCISLYSRAKRSPLLYCPKTALFASRAMALHALLHRDCVSSSSSCLGGRRLLNRRARSGANVAVRVAAASGSGRNRLREKEQRKSAERARDYEGEMDDYVRKYVTGGVPGERATPSSSSSSTKEVAERKRSLERDVKRALRKAKRAVKKTTQTAVDALLPRSSLGGSASSSPVRMAPVSYRPRGPSAAEQYGQAALAWTGVFATAWLALRVMNGENPLKGLFSRPRAPPRGASGPGRWVGDRSLGGRQVWVPYETAASRDSIRRLESALDDAPGGGASNAANMSATAAAAAAVKAKAAAKALPDWWTQPTPQYVPPGRADDLVKLARVQGAKLAQKRVGGAGFSPESIADFRNACAAAGSGGAAATSVGPESARLAVFRAAAEFAVDDALRGQSGALSSFNTPVGPFLVGLCDDLALTPTKCVSVVTASVAVRVRGALVQAGAAIRSKDSVEVMLELNKLVNLFNAFPLAPGAPELDMLSAGLRSRLTDAERESLLAEFVDVSGGAYADVVKEAIFGAQQDT